MSLFDAAANLNEFAGTGVCGIGTGLQAHLRALVVRMATESAWGYTRIQGALRNLGHRVGRSTIARILRAEGIPPGRQRPMTWRAFVQRIGRCWLLRFLTTEVWTVRGLVTQYTAFVLHLESRRVQVIGSTPYPDEAFVIQCLRQVTGETGLLCEGQILLCDHERPAAQRPTGVIHRRQRVGGILNYYYRSAA